MDNIYIYIWGLGNVNQLGFPGNGHFASWDAHRATAIRRRAKCLLVPHEIGQGETFHQPLSHSQSSLAKLHMFSGYNFPLLLEALNPKSPFLVGFNSLCWYILLRRSPGFRLVESSPVGETEKLQLFLAAVFAMHPMLQETCLTH